MSVLLDPFFSTLTDSDGSVVTDNAFGYNLRSEVTNAVMGTDTYAYEFDPIGNRRWARMNADTAAYAANALNQYVCITNPVNPVNPVQNLPSYDLDGNLLTNGPWAYTWDAENRMTSACSNGVLLVVNTYDHLSRRISKEVHARPSPSFEFQVSRSHTFLYDGWNVVREAVAVGSGSTQSAITNYYTWGLDLSGTPQGAGGVGGLLAVTTVRAEPGNSPTVAAYYPTYDGNGNVTAYIDQTGAVVASRAYDPFGQTTAFSGPLVGEFSYWFSTKRLDAETGMYDYGYRFYSPELGQWMSRDPIEEDGGLNLYGYLNNKPHERIDLLGLTCCCNSVRLTFNLGGRIFEWGIYDFMGNMKRIGNKLHIKWTVTGDAPSECTYQQNEIGSLLVYDWDPKGKPPQWSIKTGKNVTKDNPVSQEYDDRMGADLDLSSRGHKRKFQINVTITFLCHGNSGSDVKKILAVNGEATARKTDYGWVLESSAGGVVDDPKTSGGY